MLAVRQDGPPKEEEAKLPSITREHVFRKMVTHAQQTAKYFAVSMNTSTVHTEHLYWALTVQSTVGLLTMVQLQNCIEAAAPPLQGTLLALKHELHNLHRRVLAANIA